VTKSSLSPLPEDAAVHWNSVFKTKAIDKVSWFQAEPTTSLRQLQRWASPAGSVIDIGAGASTLVDALLNVGWKDVTVLDISDAALNKVRNRLGGETDAVTFVTADIRSWLPNRTFDAWHDRATFHFLVEAPDRDRYVAIATNALRPGGVVVLATFAMDGPTECSGLPTNRYDTDELVLALGPGFALEHAEREEHATPLGTIQRFSWVVFRRL
jgi:SAM-dependent methyltransferase